MALSNSLGQYCMEEDQRYAESGHTANYLDELISKKSSDDNQNKTPVFFPKDVWLFNYCACPKHTPANTLHFVIQPYRFHGKPDLMLGMHSRGGSRGGNLQSVEGLESLGHCLLVEGIRLL